MNLQDKIDKWAESTAGKKKLNSARINLFKSRSHAAQKLLRVQELSTDNIVERFIEKLNSEMVEKLGYSFTEYIVKSEPDHFITSDGRCWTEVELVFDPEKIRRNSLDSDSFPEGAYDIVALLNHGYQADGWVYGYWAPANKEVRSLKERKGTFFIQEAVNQFTAGSETIKVLYNEKYDER